MIKSIFDSRYKKLMDGKIESFSFGEISYLLDNLDIYRINTLCIQKADNKFYCAVDTLTVQQYKRDKIEKHQRLVEAIKDVQSKRQENG